MALSSDISEIKSHYTVVVIGSGYGGSIAASRMARAGQTVCLLERGREIEPGEYPNTADTAAAEMQLDLPGRHIGSHAGLFDFRVNKEMNVLIGCGLGGTSLINANVSLKAEHRVLGSSSWPREFREDIDTLVEDGYIKAQEMLKPMPYPEIYPKLKKLEALEASSKNLGGKFYRPPINVNFDQFPGGINHVGVEQQPCNNCGDCVSGCNYKAKNTTLMNYLPDACNHGAEIFTKVSVRFLEKQGKRWLVHYQVVDADREIFDAPTLFVSGDIVILSAGSLGSTEILMRSKNQGLLVSDQLGQHFSGNGDVLAFGYNCDQTINGIGFGKFSPRGREPVGPCITGIIDQRDLASEDEAMVIEEGSIPGALSKLLPVTMAAANLALGQDTQRGIINRISQWIRQQVSIILGSYKGALKNTQTYLVMSHDQGSGRMMLVKDRIRISWPTAGTTPFLKTISNRLQSATIPIGGIYLRNPIWSKLFGHDMVTVHPIGGCIMGETAEMGVVNHKHQVFSSNSGDQVHEGLYISDGSVIPTPLAVNPLLTISAITERACSLIAKDYSWNIDYSLPSQAKKQQDSAKIGIQFTETMRGYFKPGIVNNYQSGFEAGKQGNSPIEFTLTVISDDLEEMLKNYQHEAKMVGTVTAPVLSDSALTVKNGTFHLFTFDPVLVNSRQMLYEMTMVAESGEEYLFCGFKEIKNDNGIDLWPDTTTLYITIYSGVTKQSPVLGQGILHIKLLDFARQMTTIEVINAPNKAAEVKAIAKFGSFFAGRLFDVYGGIFAKPSVFAPDAPPREKRPLRTCSPQLYSFKTEDGVQLQLTRYQSPQASASRLPVMLCHGLGVSSLIFAIDTIETTLVEYLYQRGYDVWLLDYRSSIAFPENAQLQSSADVIARQDYPAAVAKVLAISGAPKLDVVVHCYGSTTFFMAMLSGLQGVRSAVSSQIATHMKVPSLTALKSGLHVPQVLDALGFKTLTAAATEDEVWWEKLFDRALKLYPASAGPGDTNPVSRRIAFLYGPLYEISQLNTQTYNSLHEMFGLGAITAFEHLIAMIRAGHLVDQQNNDTYITDENLKKLAIPITFIHGAKNQCWLPESTEITLKLLQEHNPNIRYRRHLINDYGHIDCIFGMNASRDVFPYIHEHLSSLA